MSRSSNVDEATEEAVRLAAFDWLDRKLAAGVYEFSRAMLQEFTFESKRIPLADMGSGIRTPAGFRAALALVSSTDSRSGHYGDEIDPLAGTVQYAYQVEKTARNVTANRSIRAAMPSVPLVYFEGVRDGWFVPHYPAYVVADDPDSKRFTILLDQEIALFADPWELSEIQKEYTERIVRSRVHQRAFRARVLRAYESQCSICRFHYPELLDAAHIVPDSRRDGSPAVVNGVALCKLHHAAYDTHLLGITALGRVQVQPVLLADEDGLTLRYGLQAINGARIHLPRREAERPDPLLLDARFSEFLAACEERAAASQ